MRIFLLVIALLFSACGMEEESDLDIVGGQRAPFMQAYARVGGCGATLIKKDDMRESRWLISAKHCGNPKKATIGLWKKGSGNGGKPKEEIRITKIIKHPSWDLQLLKLERRSKFKPIPLYQGNLTKGDKLSAFGFGNTEYKGSSPEYLQGAVFKYHGEGARPGIIRAENRAKHAVCHGDSGGPLVANGKLVATITFTEGNCSIYGLMGFTKIDMQWIARYVKGA